MELPEDFNWRQVFVHLNSTLVSQGLDIIHPFQVQRYNEVVDEHLHLPTFGRTNTFGVVIGNTLALWEALVNYCAVNFAFLFFEKNPVDRYSMKVVELAVNRLMASLPGSLKNSKSQMEESPSSSPALQYEVRYVHHTQPGKLVAVQSLAQVAGLAYYCRKSALNIHPVYGPWLAFRAVLVFDMDGPDQVLLPSHLPSPKVINFLQHEGLSSSSAIPSLCHSLPYSTSSTSSSTPSSSSSVTTSLVENLEPEVGTGDCIPIRKSAKKNGVELNNPATEATNYNSFLSLQDGFDSDQEEVGGLMSCVNGGDLPHPCPEVQPLMEKALREALNPQPGDEREDWERWLAVRDTCTLGREYRYPPLMIKYHYTHERSSLARAVSERQDELSRMQQKMQQQQETQEQTKQELNSNEVIPAFNPPAAAKELAV